MRVAAMGLCMTVFAGVAEAQHTRAAGRYDAVTEPDFSLVAGVVEIAGGRIVVHDSRERNVFRVDFAAGSIQPVAPSGSGPGEVRDPWRLIPLDGDSAGVFDMANSRILVVRPDGRPGGFVPLADYLRNDVQGINTAFFVPATKTAIYLDLDSAAVPYVVRRSGARVLREKLARPIATGTRVMEVEGRRVIFAPMRGAGGEPISPFNTPAEIWTASTDGWVALLGSEPYRVDFLPPNGPRIVGTPVPVPPTPVTPATRDSVLAERARANSPGPLSTTPQYRWPATLPPFHDTRTTLMFAPNGHAWVQRVVRGEDLPRYDVFDRTGTLVQRVTLVSGERLVGFGRNHLYVVARTEDDLEMIRRIPFRY